jgi:hypothetical protein
MEHSISKVKVYQSKDYKLFQLVEGNRVLNKNKIQRIINEINAGNDVLDLVPILVKENGKRLSILDGQHRFEVAKKLDRPVHYILQKVDMNLYAVAKVNSNTEKWKPTDFINAYKKAGNTNYDKIEHLHTTYGIGVSTCLFLLVSGGNSKEGGKSRNMQHDFETGQFVVKKYKEAIMVAEMCKNFSRFPAWNTREFIYAICKIMEAGLCDFEVLMKKFNADPEALKVHNNNKGYLTNLEEIYNKNNSKRRTLY